MAIQIHITLKSKEEKKQIARLAKDAGLSLSNYLRKCAGLEPLQHGGKRKKRRKPMKFLINGTLDGQSFEMEIEGEDREDAIHELNHSVICLDGKPRQKGRLPNPAQNWGRGGGFRKK